MIPEWIVAISAVVSAAVLVMYALDTRQMRKNAENQTEAGVSPILILHTVMDSFYQGPTLALENVGQIAFDVRFVATQGNAAVPVNYEPVSVLPQGARQPLSALISVVGLAENTPTKLASAVEYIRAADEVVIECISLSGATHRFRYKRNRQSADPRFVFSGREIRWLKKG